MPSSSKQSEGTWHCKPCNLLFSSWEKLHQHKGSMRRAGKLKHIHCKFCSEDFKTERAEIKHIQEFHPQEQDLECPACGAGPFVRLGGLMAHFEGKCHRVGPTVIEEMRERKLEFPNKLEALTEQTVKANYTKYMPSASTCGSTVAWETSSNPEPFLLKKNEFPGLSSQPSRPGTQKVDNRRAEPQPENQLPISWDTKKKLFPDAPQAQQPTKEQLDGATAPSARMMFEALDPDHPDHPAFNSARYYSTLTEKFLCPRVGCPKGFKKAGGLIGHLMSPAHSSTKYRCPYCLRTFSSLTAVTQHAESSAVRCRIRETDTYNAYLDQLTSGIVDVSLGRNQDGTLKYKTTDEARETFRPGSTKTASTASVLGEKLDDKDPWKGKDVHW